MHVELKKICCPHDFSDAADHALVYALTLAQQFGAQLHLLHVVQEIVQAVPEPGLSVLPTEEIMRDLEKGAASGLEKMVTEEWRQKVSVVRTVLHGSPFREINRYAKQQEIDLIIVGTHGRTGIAHLLMGSVAEKVVRTAPCPVLTVRHPEHEFVLPD